LSRSEISRRKTAARVFEIDVPLVIPDVLLSTVCEAAKLSLHVVF